MMLAGFGAIGLSLLLFMLMDRAETVGSAVKKVSDILAPFVYGGVVAYLLRPLCNHYERFFKTFLPKKMKKAAADLNFEVAAELRDSLIELKQKLNSFDD